MKRDINRTRAALLRAAEKLMTSCEDVSQLTSRAITKEAGVNLAMINYCFGSREKLLAEVFGNIMAKAQLADPRLSTIMDSDLPPAAKLAEIHISMMRLMLDSFAYSEAVTRYILLERDLSFGMESLPLVVEHFRGKKTEEECRLITYSITSLNELAVLKHAELKEKCCTDLTDEEQLRRFVENNISKFLDIRSDNNE
ncbi:MAG: TetR family transcriptional regulator [Ruminococcus sp.]|nr:TetR family transcriptional regulator [Ruminococcus sp.]